MKLQNRQLLVPILAAALAAAACGGSNSLSVPEKTRILDQAFTLSQSDPTRAASLFADAGPGPSLETSRMTVWAACLERTSAAPDEWRRYLSSHPPEPLAGRARLKLMRTLIERGAFEAALAVRSQLPIERLPEADEQLFVVDEPVVRSEAARRLAISSPVFLAAADGELDRRLASTLSPEEHLARSRAWRQSGRSRRAASELGRERWDGEIETRRRREMARAELEAGSPGRALTVLPPKRDANAADLVLRAQAYRDRGWDVFPTRTKQRFFAECVSASEAAIALDPSADQRQAALVLRLECATQAGRLETALASWRTLEAEQWVDPRRDWLGRRLGVALVRSGGEVAEVDEIARQLPIHERCLCYWAGAREGDETDRRSTLVDVGIADVYGQWSRQELAEPKDIAAIMSPMIAPGEPPKSVARLLASGLHEEALREWQRIREYRPPFPEEALAAAELAATYGQLSDSIRWLRAGFPELGTVDMDRAPENVIRAYLPLRWQSAMVRAARESGLDPWLIAGIARQESGFAAHAVSPRGAVGVLQLLPATARLHAGSLGLGSQPDLRDPELNIRLGARELGSLVRRFGALEPALAAYNTGLTRVRSWWKEWPDRHRFTEEIPVPETYNYVRRVMYLSEAYRLVYNEAWRISR